MTRIHFIGGEKGGVGKSVLARLLAQYHIDNNKPFKAFDGDLSHGALARFYNQFTEVVDLSDTECADRIFEVASEDGCDVIVDLAAQSNRPLNRWIEEVGLLELCEEMGIKLTFWHVMDDGTDSVRLLDRMITTHGDQADYILVRNHGRGSNFSAFNESDARVKAEAAGALVMDLPALNSNCMRKIDQINASLWAAANNKNDASGPTLGMMERQRVRMWLKRSYEQLDHVLAACKASEVGAYEPAANE